MKNAFIQFRRHWLTNLVVFLSSLFVGGVIFVLYFFLRNRSFIDAVNGSAISGMIVFLSGLLVFMHHLGAFDTFVFGFKQLGSAIFAKDARRDGKYSDYRQEKTEKRKNSSYVFISIVAAGLTILIAALILEIIYHTKY